MRIKKSFPVLFAFVLVVLFVVLSSNTFGRECDLCTPIPDIDCGAGMLVSVELVSAICDGWTDLTNFFDFVIVASKANERRS